ncbi:uncharacterized protein RAG0_01814 [Rhynchosporium agropyri]|uniref:F-box domain-containing protein n=1 Tax=Rhynchosporium agropyri TaxID=914238 RepID=A0A1E1JYX8_9HELO|nr:uncharacterized protein RAG0_01814 [Rhynchosporium agropyri]
MPIWELTRERCVDYRNPDMLPRVWESLEKLISRIPADTLQSFTWDTGTCLPEHILRPEGTLANLQLFTKLKSLTWRGLSNPTYFEALASLLQSTAFAGRLETLEFDFVNWKDAERNWRHHEARYRTFKSNFFSEHIIGKGKVVLKSLKNLSLTDVSFGGAEEELIKQLNIRSLDRLKLIICPFTFDMFDVILEIFDLSFKRLELVLDSETRFSIGDDAVDVDYNQYANTLSTMIRSCVDLDDLFIVITELDEDEQMLYALEHQQNSLKRPLLCAYNEYSTEALLGRRVKQSSWGAIKHLKKSGSIVSVWGSEEEEEEDTDNIPEEKRHVTVQSWKFNCSLFHIRIFAEWDLVDENMDFLGSCPSTKILDTVGIDDDWTESEYDDEEEGNDGADGQIHGAETGGSDKADDVELKIGGKDGNENN